eukprot:gene17677-21620_t
MVKDKQLNAQKLKELRASSPLGEILAAGLANSKHGREIMKECIEEAASRVIHELERYLNTLGTIAAAAPLLGLLGTVIGMIEIFGSQGASGAGGVPGMGDPAQLARGISIALYNTAFGLIVAIPAPIFWRYFRGRVDDYLLGLELAAERTDTINFRPGTRDEPEINLIPFIDILLV